MAVNIYRAGPPWEGPPPSQNPGSGWEENFCSLKTHCKSALRALEASLLFFIFFLGLNLQYSAHFNQLRPSLARLAVPPMHLRAPKSSLLVT